MRLPNAPKRYDEGVFTQWAQILMRLFTRVQYTDNDIVVKGSDGGTDGRRLLLTSPDGTQWKVNVDNSGNLTTTAV